MRLHVLSTTLSNVGAVAPTPRKANARHYLQLSAICLGSLFAAVSATAQESEQQLEEIIVTAEFRRADVQETPIAITAITGDMIDNRAQTNLYEVANQAPNVTLKRGGQARSGMIAFIRGVGQYDFIAALEPGVGVYVDDVYYAQLTGSLLELLDVDRVEVLRGPQGTLSGRNSIGGAVKMFTKKPGEDNGGFARVGFGSYDQVDFRGAGDMTLVEDKLYARFSAAGKTRDGYVKVLDYACTHPGSNVPTNALGDGCQIGTQGEQKYATGRVQLRWIASDDLEINFAADYLNDKSGIAPGVATYADRTAIEAAVDGDGNAINPTITLEDQFGNITYYRDHMYVPYGPYHNSDDPINDPYVSYATAADYGPQYLFAGAVGGPAVTAPAPWKPTVIPPRNYITQWGASVGIDWNISDTLSLTSITAYREYDSLFTWDEDASPVALNQLDNRLDNWQLTQELRLNGSAGDVDWTLGGYYLDQNSHYEARVTLNYALIDFTHGPDPTPADTKAAFAHATWHVTDNFTLSGGLRYSDEFKSYTHHRHNPDGTEITGIPGQYNWRLGGIEGLTAEFEDQRTDWRIAAAYNVNDDSMLYGSVSTGYKGGGVNPRPFFPVQLKTFDPEELTSYELGWKSDWLDNTLRLNVAAFFTKYDNIQLILKQCEVPVFIDPDLVGPPCLKPANVGDAEIKGVELEATWYLTDNFLVDVSASTLDFEYQTVDPATGVTTDMITPYTPEDKWAIGAQYTVPTGLGDWMFRVDGSYMSEVYADPANGPTNFIDGYTLVNGIVRWTAPDDAWSIEAQWANVTDELYYIDAYDVSTSQGTTIMQPGLPSTFNIAFQRNFD